MDIAITVSEADVTRISRIGNKPWAKTTQEERTEYEHLIALYGTKVCMQVLNRGR